MPRVTSAPYLRPLSSPVEPSPEDRAQALVARALAGDEAAWGRLYQESFDDLYRQLRYLTGEPALAEELAQETFAQAMASRGRYDAGRSFRGWLHGIAVNVARKHWRKSRNRERAHARLEQGAGHRLADGDPGEAQVRRERSNMLYRVLEDLPERLREAFILRELQGLGTAEAAELLDLSPGNLAVRVSRARARIREELIRRGWLATDGGMP